ncbi:ABC transporter ATP-binding protein [Geobacillus sp. G4]|uniref:Peptide ABC transporter ATP-binding protein n=4 Tax=Geobacillus TaxID=129337 RepID=A0A7U9J9Y2_GEOTM|nr:MULTISPECIES: ABC transporter ATP-binding protein [Geobacillus]ALA70848.1 peptide ABC transporter ATP-binding protein [Geobacillus stearothermophilus 10]ADI27939.1 oligopeptide/dipeptide ABC transporter, ATPase subunit [Geobacillus sp. C56-T3]AOL33434.1 peptide ABC transporter ATP-binding protein [Geobacillus thermoleovorans]AUI36419.1 ABC transporter ATP-binding protein [[Bacillus] caldolyticus]ESU71686.1 peptide ABC transporter ATP-binding protein [Geobacillus sp. MAS1]
MGEKILLEVRGLRTSFFTDDGEIPAVDGVDFSIREGEVLGIVGESGCGKSVTSLSIMGLLPKGIGKVVGGEIWFKGENLIEASERRMKQIRGNEIAMIFQEPMTSLNPLFTIGNQLVEAIRLHTKIGKKEARARAVEMLKLVGLPRAEQMLDEYPHQLSGGMRQRVMIAMAMVCRPALLIADEPTTALDVTIQAQILALMKELNQTFGTAVMMITHDLGVVAELCDRVIVMYAGQIVEEGSVRDIFRNPKHPYTAGLIRSIPDIRGKKERLYSIPGQVPKPGTVRCGCRFAARCEWVVDRCRHEDPLLYETSEQGHRARCFLALEKEGLVDERAAARSERA